MPKSRGGKNEWTNLVTSCFKCNLKKSDRTPEEAKMIMRKKPFAPTLITENEGIKNLWEDFQGTFVF